MKKEQAKNAMDMMTTKLSIIENVSRAKGELGKALEGLETLPAFDPHAFGFAAQEGFGPNWI